ncbi:MAG: hypothetical protein ACYTG0_33350 [Planctomycetota bacterium]|jgi:hypothetical protein
MRTCVREFDNLENLRDYVNQTICEHYELQIDAFRLTERILQRGGKPCGVYFCLHGPRAARFTAIWETDRNRVLFYGPTGERYLRTQLLDAPELTLAEAPRLEQVAA